RRGPITAPWGARARERRPDWPSPVPRTTKSGARPGRPAAAPDVVDDVAGDGEDSSGTLCSFDAEGPDGGVADEAPSPASAVSWPSAPPPGPSGPGPSGSGSSGPSSSSSRSSSSPGSSKGLRR